MAETAPSKIAQIGRASRRRSKIKLRYLIVATTALWAAYVYVFQQAPLFEQQRAEQASLTARLLAARTQAVQLRRDIANLHNYGYIAQVAEKKYNLIMPGEILFTANSPGKP